MSKRLCSFICQFNPRRTGAIESVLKFALDMIPGEFAQYDRFDFKGGSVARRQSRSYPHKLLYCGELLGAICRQEFVQGGRPSVAIQDVADSPYGDPDAYHPMGGPKAYIGCPVLLQAEPAGALAVCSHTPQHFDASHAEILKALSRLIELIDEQRRFEWEVNEKLAFERLLDESKALNEQMLQLSPVAIYRIDLVRQRFIKVNDIMCQTTGYTEEEFLAMSPADLLTPKSRDLFIWRCRAMASGHPVSNNVEFEIITKSGAVEWTRFHIRHLYENGKLTGANVVAHFITEEKKAFEELARYRRQLEELVDERTSELARANRKLLEEIDQRTLTAEELEASGERLKEMNTAMRVLLDKRTEDQQRAEELIRLNLKELIDPYLERLGNSGLRDKQKQLLEVIRMNLEDVVGSSMPEFSNKCYLFSPNELHVVNLIRKGKTTKEMAGLLNLSVRTIESYRNSIRGKLNLKNKKINLKTYLNSI